MEPSLVVDTKRPMFVFDQVIQGIRREREALST